MAPFPSNTSREPYKLEDHHRTMEDSTYSGFRQDLAKITAVDDCTETYNKSSKRSDPSLYTDAGRAGHVDSTRPKKRVKGSSKSSLSLPIIGSYLIKTDYDDDIVNVTVTTDVNDSDDDVDTSTPASRNVPFHACEWWKDGTAYIRDWMTTPHDDADTTKTSEFSAASQNEYSEFLGSADKDPSPVLKFLGNIAASRESHDHSSHEVQSRYMEPLPLKTRNGGALYNAPQAFRNKASRLPMSTRKPPSGTLMPQLNQFGETTFDPYMSSQGQHYHNQQPYQLQAQKQQSVQACHPPSFLPESIHAAQHKKMQQQTYHGQRQQIDQPGFVRADIALNKPQAKVFTDDIFCLGRDFQESYHEDTSFDEDSVTGVTANPITSINPEDKVDENENIRKGIISAFVNFDGEDSKSVIENTDDRNDIMDKEIAVLIARDNGLEPSSGISTSKGTADDTELTGAESDAFFDGGNLLDSNPSSDPSRDISKNILDSSKTHLELGTDKSSTEVRFRAYQAESWTEKFEELIEFRKKKGHCLVPNCYPDNPALAQWTKRQRYQYKLKLKGNRSTLTDERVDALEDIGFIWDSHKAVWSERLQELAQFKKRFGHCNVPSRYKDNHQLAIWVKRQRRQWKNELDGKPHCMTEDRKQALEAIGFVWDMKMLKYATKGNKENVKKKMSRKSKGV